MPAQVAADARGKSKPIRPDGYMMPREKELAHPAERRFGMGDTKAARRDEGGRPDRLEVVSAIQAPAHVVFGAAGLATPRTAVSGPMLVGIHSLPRLGRSTAPAGAPARDDPGR